MNKVHVAATSPFPIGLQLSKADGVYFYDTSGRAYFDFTSGIAVNNLGHRHPAVVEAIKKQADIHLHGMVYGEFEEHPQVRLASTLCSVLPESLDTVYFCTSGGEAVEGAMKLAKRYTGRTEICYFKGSYHGSTHGALSIMGSEVYKQAYRPLLPDTRMLPYNDSEALNLITHSTAGVVVEVIQAASGVTLASEAWLQALRQRCTETDTLLIFDEIQTGYGRTGKLFAFEHYGVVPDVLLLAKAMGGGVPIGAFIAQHDVMNVLSEQPILGHINTFGGNALACAAAQATLDTFIAQPDLYTTAARKAEQIIEAFTHPKLTHFTHKGLMMAAHFETKADAYAFMRRSLENGVVLIGYLFNETAVRFAPPLTISVDQIEAACASMRR